MLLTNTPDTLRFAFADPKRNAFQLLRDSPFIYGDIAYEEDETLALLERLVEEMESRYARMAEAGADTLRDLSGATAGLRRESFSSAMSTGS